LELGRRTTEAALKKWYADQREPLHASDRLRATDLVALTKRHKDEPYRDALFSLLVNHRNATAAVLRAALQASGNSLSVANAVATSAHAPISLLRRLLASRHRSVREHAQLAVIATRMADGASARAIKGWLSTFAGDAGIDLGVRALIAGSSKTPRPLLDKLVMDDADFIAATARQTIRRSARAKRVATPSRRHR
jgi:hypothetical protein